MATSYTTYNANVNSAAYRSEAKPRVFTCACGERAVYRQYDRETGESKNVCANCKKGAN